MRVGADRTDRKEWEPYSDDPLLSAYSELGKVLLVELGELVKDDSGWIECSQDAVAEARDGMLECENESGLCSRAFRDGVNVDAEEEGGSSDVLTSRTLRK